MRRRGFTLLEVMIAVAILGLAMTAIFSSEVGAAKVANRSRKTSTAALLARCKMGEIEELIANEGLPAVEKKGTDQCCDGAEVEGFECDWHIMRIVLPDITEDTEDEEGDGQKTGADLLSLGAQAGSAEDYISGEGDGFAGLAMQIAFPALKPSIEEQVRRATVKVSWNEGAATRSFDVTQFLVAEQPPPSESEEDEEEEGEER